MKERWLMTPKKPVSQTPRRKTRTKQAPVRKAPERTYQIRYGVLNPKQLSSRVLVLNNPGYGNAIGPHGSRDLRPSPAHASKLEQETGFYTRLKESLKEHGCINPLHALSIEQGTFCRYGTSRLYYCRIMDIPVPVIITDFVGRWTELEELHTKEDVLAKFQDKPEILVMDKDEMRIDKCKQFHLGPEIDRTPSYNKFLGR